MKQIQFDQFLPTKLYVGNGSIQQLGKIKLPGKKALVVISAGSSMRKYGYLDTVLNLLSEQHIEAVVFDKVLANPIRLHVMEAADICKKEGCDFVIGLGGGSSIDSAKSIAVMACNAGDYWDYVCGGSGKCQPVSGGALPIVAIPTTAGTGTETDPWTVISNENSNEKIGFGNNSTFPVISIVDPELMVSVPPLLTAFQGFDAFFHAAEGFIANIATPISEVLSLKSIGLLYKYLPVAVKNGADIDARSQVALASTISGMVETYSSCISQHSMEHAMSAYYPNLPHGAGLIALSAAYFSMFLQDVPEKFMQMTEAMTGRKSTDPNDFITALKDMQAACGAAHIQLSDYGITESDLPLFVTNARETMAGLFKLDPRPLSDEEVLRIYTHSYMN